MPATLLSRVTRTWYELEPWLFAQAKSTRTDAWSRKGPMPPWMEDLAGVREELAHRGVLGWHGCWAPLSDGSYLWAAISGLDWLQRSTVWMFQVSGQSSTSAGPSSPMSRSAGLPDGAPPANGTGDPLARLRALLRRRRVQGL